MPVQLTDKIFRITIEFTQREKAWCWSETDSETGRNISECESRIII